jgi:hypothetical protein
MIKGQGEKDIRPQECAGQYDEHGDVLFHIRIFEISQVEFHVEAPQLSRSEINGAQANALQDRK